MQRRRTTRWNARAVGLAVGIAWDALAGDPQRHHPVAGFGSYAAFVERRCYADSRRRGACFVALTVGPVAALGFAAERAVRRSPALTAAVTAAATWAVVGAHSLAAEGEAMAELLDADDLDGARDRLSHLCGRLSDALPSDELARATVESLAENLADSLVASLFWGTTTGVAGLVAHRAANTLDAMVGHRNPRYARFGTAAARLDDALDYLPARLTGTLICLAAPLVGGSTRAAWRIMLRDAHDHPSPNGGWCEAAMAGALGVRLGGTNVYPGGRTEQRGLLGDGDAPTADDCRRAARMVRLVTTAATLLAVGTCLARGARSAR